jgi:hypothetical protein
MKTPLEASVVSWRKRSLFVIGALVLLASLLLLLPPARGEEIVDALAALRCGNGVLDPGETCDTCPADAGVCAPFAVLCGGGKVCLTPPAPCPAVKPCQPVPPSALADARFVVDHLKAGTAIRAAARRVLAELLALDAYCPAAPSTGAMRLVLSPSR